MVNFDNEAKGMITLPGSIFNVPLRTDILQRVVVWQLAKRRQGTAKTKTRAEVSGSTRKIYRQKGACGRLRGALRVLITCLRHWWCSSRQHPRAAVPSRWRGARPTTAQLRLPAAGQGPQARDESGAQRKAGGGQSACDA